MRILTCRSPASGRRPCTGTFTRCTRSCASTRRAILEGETRYIAWFEPEHEILRAVAPFFEQRFPNMHWMIATPDGAAVWTGAHTEFVDSPARADLPRDDSTHGLWRAYYRNICNVARINPKVMQREMPQRYWRHLPEADGDRCAAARRHGDSPAQSSQPHGG